MIEILLQTLQAALTLSQKVVEMNRISGKNMLVCIQFLSFIERNKSADCVFGFI